MNYETQIEILDRQPPTELDPINRYLYMIYQSLQIAGYRLVGARCKYEWGRTRVVPVKPVTRRQRLVGLLFPTVVFAIIILIEYIVGLVFLVASPSLGLLFLLSVLIGGSLSPFIFPIIFDIRRARRLFRYSLGEQ